MLTRNAREAEAPPPPRHPSGEGALARHARRTYTCPNTPGASQLAPSMSSESDPPHSVTPSTASDADFTAEVLRRLSKRGENYGRYQLEGEVAHGGQGAAPTSS